MSEQVINRAMLVFLWGSLLLLAQTTNLIFTTKFQQYRRLAESFLTGSLAFIEQPATGWGDAAVYGGIYYWPLGVFPAVLLAPFVFVWQVLGATFEQGYITFGLLLWSVYLLFTLTRKLGYVGNDAAWLALAFVASTSYLSIVMVPWSWHLAHAVVVWLLLIAIHEYLNKRRWAIIGLVLGLVFATRVTAGLNFLFFLGALLLAPESRRNKLSSGISLAGCFGSIVLLVMYYNDLRFNSPFESGYNYQAVLKPNGPLTGPWNILPNLRFFLFGVPLRIDRFPFFIANPLGMSIFVVSPWLLFMRPQRWDSQDWLLVADILVTTVAFLMWWSTGSNQMGYRFSLDFMPMLFWLLLRTGAIQATTNFKGLVGISALLNFYFLTTVFNG